VYFQVEKRRAPGAALPVGHLAQPQNTMSITIVISSIFDELSSPMSLLPKQEAGI
jgi:hypothetical protein